jgi:hypothetical protein
MRCLTLCGYGARHFCGGAVSDPLAVMVPDTFAVMQCLTPLAVMVPDPFAVMRCLTPLAVMVPDPFAVVRCLTPLWLWCQTLWR